MNKKGQMELILIMLVVILILAFVMIYTGGISTTPEEDELPDVDDDEPEPEPDEPVIGTFKQCTTVSDCTWDPSLYYNRDCSGEWRCMDSPYAGIKLCSYGCPGNEYCGDGICGAWENEWSCIDCNPDVGFIGELVWE